MQIRTPTAQSRDYIRKSFRLPSLNPVIFHQFAEKKRINLENVDVGQIYEDFRLRHRHLCSGDLSFQDKKRVVKEVPLLNESTEYQRALYAITLHLCDFDRNKALAILYCFARVTLGNIRDKFIELSRK